MSPAQYLTLRLLDACLREDVRQLVSQGRQLPRMPLHHGEPEPGWLEIRHLPGPVLRLPVCASDHMQCLRASQPWWLALDGDRWQRESGGQRWLQRLAAGLNGEAAEHFLAYAREVTEAEAQHEICQQSWREAAPRLSRPLSSLDWTERLLHGDQAGAFLDHPFYPTARAKSGLTTGELRAFAPEFAPVFSLHWLAVPRARLHLTAPRPDWWPGMEAVGLPSELARQHALIPVHPLTWQRQARWPADSHPAPRTWLQVRPTLSVRTLQLVARPDTHLKLPLAMCTLGARNLRLIKPSTLYDGHRFSRILVALAGRDPVLAPLYVHADESCGGHVGDDPALCYLLRRYPAGLEDATLCPVASLGALMGDGRLYLQHLLEWCTTPDPRAWWREYVRLLARVHLRLWLKYGIALESNQQNAVLAFRPGRPLSLVMKDNDAARLWPARFDQACPELAELAAGFLDRRILVEEELPLAQMFTTITLQLDLAAILERLAGFGLLERESGRDILAEELGRALDELAAEGLETGLARELLFEAPRQWVKYLLLAGSLLSKAESGTADINKYYGLSGPNFLRGRA